MTITEGEADAMILADAFRQEGDARPCLLCRAKVPEWDQIDWVSRAGIVCRDCLDFVVFSH